MAVVAVIGVGRMGGAYASHLLAAGWEVVAVDPVPGRREEAAALGCTALETVAAALEADADPLILSLPSESAFEAVTADLVAAEADRPRIAIDTSTLGPGTKEAGRALLAKAGHTLLDCPVSGTGAQARQRDLVVYASGPEDAIAACGDVLAAISREVHVLGPFGSGAKVKLLANLLVGVHNAAAAEMVALAERAGVDPELAVRLAADGAGQSRMLEQRGPAMAAHAYGYGATVDLFRKDLGLIRSFARESGARTPLIDAVAALYDEAAALGWGDEESAAVHAAYLGAPRT